MTRLAPVSLSVGLLLGAAACKHPSTKLDLDKIQEAEEEDREGKAGEPATRLEPLPVERPTDLLPADVALMMEANDPAQLLAMFASLSAIPEFDMGRTSVSGVLGADVLTPGDWPKLGLDPHGPAGAAVLDFTSQAFCAWLSIADLDAFDQTVRTAANAIGIQDGLTVGEIAGARVYRFDDELNIVVRANIAMFVVVGRPTSAPRDFPGGVATIDPRDGLARSEGFQWARAQSRPADDGLIYILPAQLHAADMASRGEEAYSLNYAEEQLAEARRSGDAARIAELERMVTQEKTWQRERAQALEAEDALAHELFGSIRAVVISGDVQPTQIDAQARVLMPTGLLREVFVPSQSQSPLLGALDEPVLFMVDGQADVQKFLRLLDLMAKADGESLDEIDQKIRAETGISPLSSVVPLLDGRAGFAVTRSRAPDPKQLEEIPKSLGLAIHIGLRDPDGMRKLLDDLARNPLAATLFKRRKTGWELDVPEWRKLTLDVAGDRLIVSTDKQLAGRIRGAKSGKHPLGTDHLARSLAAPGVTPALQLYQDWAWVVLVEPPNLYIQTLDSLLYDIDSHATLSREQAAKVPQSKAEKQIRKELMGVLREIEVIDTRRAERAFNDQHAALTELGEFGMELDLVPDGLSAHGLWRTRGKRSMVEIAVSMTATSWVEDPERDRLNSRSWELATEIRRQRAADLDAWVASNPTPTP